MTLCDRCQQWAADRCKSCGEEPCRQCCLYCQIAGVEALCPRCRPYCPRCTQKRLAKPVFDENEIVEVMLNGEIVTMTRKQEAEALDRGKEITLPVSKHEPNAEFDDDGNRIR